MDEPAISFLLKDIVLVVILITFIQNIFALGRFAFIFELNVAIVFIFLLTLAMYRIYENDKSGWLIVGATMTLLLINTLSLALIKRTFEWTAITITFFSFIGWITILLELSRKIHEEAEAKNEMSKWYYNKMQTTSSTSI